MLTPPHSKELLAGFDHARRLAARAMQPVTSTHVLLGLFCYANKARALFLERHLDELRIQAAVTTAHPHREPIQTLDKLCQRAEDVAHNVGATAVDCLHLLVAISRTKECEAYRALECTGTSLTTLRHVAVAHMTGSAPKRAAGLNPRRRSHLPPTLRPDCHTERRTKNEEPGLKRGLADGRGEKPPALRADHGPNAPMAEEFGLGDAPFSTGQSFFKTIPTNDAVPADDVQQQELKSLSDGPKFTASSPLEDIAPTLAECGIDLTARARAGLLDAAIARDKELEALADVLGKRRANNPVLVGPPGVGKTAIVEGLALLWTQQADAQGASHLPQTAHRRIVALDTGAMVAGTSLRGSFSERLCAIKNEVAQAKGQIVVFIDELHTLIGAGASGEGPQDAAGELKAALARGEFPCIGATTEDEFKRYIERDPALERRFTAVAVNEPNCEQACRIVHGAIAPYASHHEVSFNADAIDAAVHQSHRFVPERKLPDKAFAVLDLAGSRARRRGEHTVGRIDVARVLNDWTGVPLERLVQADAARFARAEEHLSKHLIGHGHVIDAVAQALRRGFAGFNERRPMGSFLFLGPTGVGKTEMVKVLADFVFGQRDRIVRFDMSELVEKHAVARLLGAQPGYVGYEDGGQLTEALRKRPFQIVLFDEVEKAHPEVINVLLQILDEGHLTDTQGRRISFAHTVVVLTSNLGAEAATGPQTIGFGDDGDKTSAHKTQSVLDLARSQLSPELWSRLDEHLVFLPLTVPQVTRIALVQLKDKERTLHKEHSIGMSWDEQVVAYLLRNGGFSPKTGARGLRKVIAKFIEAPMADMILAGSLAPGSHVHVAMHEQGLQLVAKPT